MSFCPVVTGTSYSVFIFLCQASTMNPTVAARTSTMGFYWLAMELKEQIQIIRANIGLSRTGKGL